MTDKTTDTFRSAMRTVLDMAPEAPDIPIVDERQQVRRPVLAAVSGFAIVLLVGGVGAVLVAQTTDEPVTTLPATVADPAATEGLSWHPVVGAPDLESVRVLVPGCCRNVALGDDSWAAGYGESFTGPGAQPIPPEIGLLRSITNGGGGVEVVAVPAVGASTTPYVATYELTGQATSNFAWTIVALPTDVPSPHPDVVMYYTVQSVAFTSPVFAVYGWAQPEVDPAAIEREYPELAPVVRTDWIPPCCDGEPLSTEIADPLWVWTDDASTEPTAISLGKVGLTREDLQNTTGVVWVFDRPTAPAPWVATTTLIADDVGPEFFLESGETGGFALLIGRTTGGYDAWTSPSGTSWTKLETTLRDVVDLAVWGRRVLVLTAARTILELKPDGTLTSFADADTFDLPDAEPADPVRFEAGDAGVVVVGEREEVLPWSDGEPIPTAQVLWFSPDGSTWRHQELSDIFGDIGAIDILVTIHQGHREVPPTVIAAFGPGQENGEPIIAPQWWAAQTK